MIRAFSLWWYVGLSLLLMAAGCEPGEGARPPNTLVPGAGGVAVASRGVPPTGVTAAVGGTTFPAPSGAGAAAVGPLPSGGTGAGGIITVPPGGTGAPPPPPDGGLPPFDGGIEPNRNQVQPGGICSRLATINCAAEQHCCNAPGRTFEACKSALTTDCTMNAHLDEVAQNSVAGYSSAVAATAFAKLEELSAACDPSVTVWALSPTGLRGIYQGTVEPTQQCKPTGFPSVVGYGATLASCKQPATHACLFSGNGPTAAPTSATCAARGGAGATCFVDSNCMDGLYCNNPDQKYSTGKCAAGKAAGASCTTEAECASQTCKSSKCVVATAQTAYCLNQ
ncbi:MAG TPA: Dickkopf N-terminal cysteine-rich domain-containing protein [Polyangiales bacterium]|nr:Dickkopf N-terminal cysteine-rich domain-containing protein [Polyangiales bacterium]